jgi:hypothetical protein
MEDVEHPKPATELHAPEYPGANYGFDVHSNGQTHPAKVGDVFSVSLVSIPTAGYSWFAILILGYAHDRRVVGDLPDGIEQKPDSLFGLSPIRFLLL